VGEQPQGRVPPGKHREALERARAAETERDTFKTTLEQTTRTFTEKLDSALRQIDDLRRGPRTEPKAIEVPPPQTIPDIFEDPKGFVENLQKGFQTEIGKVLHTVRQNGVATSFELAHVKHGEAFPNAMEAINKLNPENPDDRTIVQRIYNSPNPGEALVRWHKRNETFARVGDDPTKFEADIRKSEREALMKDPEFRKALIADLRGDAARGDNGNPRTETRLPKSLHRATGSNVGVERGDPHQYDDSEQSVADAAWR
jgi:hypothetical protein